MVNVIVVGFDYSLASAITGVVDFLSMVGVTWNRAHGLPDQRKFNVKIASPKGGWVNSINHLRLKAHCRLDEVTQADLILIPTIGGNIEISLRKNQELTEWLHYHYEQGANIASNCTGAFLLANSGLLNDKLATTHWAYADQFRAMFPGVLLAPERLITHDGQLFCSGGGIAWLDLAVYLVERYCDHEIARAAAKAWVMPMSRDTQINYSALKGKRYHQDEEILNIQDWLENNYQRKLLIDEVAAEFNLTPRTFKRRFKAAVGEPPIAYLQALRIEAAKKLLELNSHTIDTVIQLVGYDDVSSFNKLFKRFTGITPGVYRNKFGRG